MKFCFFFFLHTFKDTIFSVAQKLYLYSNLFEKSAEIVIMSMLMSFLSGQSSIFSYDMNYRVEVRVDGGCMKHDTGNCILTVEAVS